MVYVYIDFYAYKKGRKSFKNGNQGKTNLVQNLKFQEEVYLFEIPNYVYLPLCTESSRTMTKNSFYYIRKKKENVIIWSKLKNWSTRFF